MIMKTRDVLFTEDFKARSKLKYAILMAYSLSMCVCLVLGSIIYLIHRLT
jgi:hypothetical protein